MENNCVAGCKHFTGGEIRHCKGCNSYPESFSEMYDKLEKENELLRFMIDNGLDEKDMINDITLPNEI